MFGVPVPMFGPGGPPMRMGPPMPPPPMMGGPPKTRVPPPESLPYQVSLRHFTDYLAEAYPAVARDKEQLDEAWRKYKLQFSNTQLTRFFHQHAGQAWFRERYAPAEAELRKRLRDKGREGRVEAFVAALEGGEYDETSFDFVPSAKPAEPVPAPSTEPEPAADASDVKPDTNGDGEDAAGDGDASADPAGDETMETDEKPTEADVAAADGGMQVDGEAIAADGEKPAVPASDAPPANGNAAPAPRPNPQQRRGARPEIPADELVIIPPNDLQLFIKAVKPELSRVDLERVRRSPVPLALTVAALQPGRGLRLPRALGSAAAEAHEPARLGQLQARQRHGRRAQAAQREPRQRHPPAQHAPIRCAEQLAHAHRAGPVQRRRADAQGP